MWRAATGWYRFAEAFKRRPHDLDRTTEGGGKGSSPGQRRRTVARWSLRWLEMRGDVPEGIGTRGKHGEARLETASKMRMAALAGEAQFDGAARILVAVARRSSGDLLLDESLHKTKGKRAQGMRHNTGKREQERSGGGALEQPESAMNCGG